MGEEGHRYRPVGPRKPRVRRPRFYREDRPTQTSFDTETYRGDLRVICCPDAFFEPTDNVEDLLKWMLDHGAEVVWFYNLRFDADVILKLIFKSIDILKNEEAKLRFLTEHSVQVGSYIVTLIGGKSFRVEQEKTEETARRSIECFDVSSFYTEDERRITLDEAAFKMFGEGKSNKKLEINRKSIGRVAGYYEANREKIIQYCKDDARLTARLGESLVDTAREALGVYPRRWSSAASMAKAWLERNHPEIMARDKKVDKFFRPSFRGGIFVTRVLGRMPNQTEADITNAYGTALTRLRGLAGLEVRNGPERSKDAVYGSYFIAIGYDGRLPWRVSDLGIRLPQKHEGDDKDKTRAVEKVLYPISDPGEEHLYCATRSELDFFDQEGIPYRMLYADELCGDPKGLMLPDFPDLVAKVVALKEAAKHDVRMKLLRECLKRVVNSTYGSLAESRHGETPITTWPLAAEITASCRVTIWREWRKIEQAGGVVVSVNTDSLRYVPGDYKVPTAKGELGKFANKFVGHTVTHVQSGIAIIEHPRDCGCDGEYVPDEDPEWSDKRKETFQKSVARIVRVDDPGKNPQYAFEGETDSEIVKRIRHPPHPWQRGGLELHQPTCPCPRCVRMTLRKRGMPSITAVDLLRAKGSAIEVVSARPIHAIEGVIQDRMDDVADIPDGEDEIAADDGTRRRELSLLSNLVTAVYNPKDLTFQRLNSGPVIGQPIPMDALLERDWIKDAIAQRRVAEAEIAQIEAE